MGAETPEEPRSNFIRDIIDADLQAGRHDQVVTRFPPEPNGYLHIGHAKSICLNFGLARDYDGRCHLRFDDTNPSKEEVEYVESIKHDVRWLGFDWGEHLYFASDYFERMYSLAEHLVEQGKAYVDSLDRDTIREYRGTLTEPGKPSPYRERSVAENLDLFRRMRAGEFEDGAHVLRAKIDMSSPNMLMRDPILYRIQHAHHHNTGDAWCIYPMYDYAHCLEDAFEEVTHSICTLEFENNRELYDWVIEATEVECVPHQYEFARLALEYTVMSKRKLLQLVQDGHVSGWDDPRMPTIAGLRRRGVRPEAIRRFADLIGVAKANSTVAYELWEYAVRDDLNMVAPRVMCVVDPLKVTLTNAPEDFLDELDCPFYPHDVPLEGSRAVPFTRELYIERSDFAEDPPKGWHRLAPGREVRLRYAYYVTCDEVVKDDDGNVVELKCTYDPQTRGGSSSDGRKVKGTLHWVSATHATDCEVRLYDRLFSVPFPEADPETPFLDHLNPSSLARRQNAKIEPSVVADTPDTRYQFERQGYFWRDRDSTDAHPVFNLIVGLRDSWAKHQKKTADETPAADPKADATAEEPRAERNRPQKRSASYERDKAREENPDLAEKLRKFESEWGVPPKDADILTASPGIASFYESVVDAAASDAVAVAKWVVNTMLPLLGEDVDPGVHAGRAADVALLIQRVDEAAITAAVSGEVLVAMLEEGRGPDTIISERGLQRVTDVDELGELVAKVIADNPDEAARYREGKTSLLGFFIGKVMAETGGTADARTVRALLGERL